MTVTESSKAACVRAMKEKEAEEADVMVLSAEEEKAFIQEAIELCNHLKSF